MKVENKSTASRFIAPALAWASLLSISTGCTNPAPESEQQSNEISLPLDPEDNRISPLIDNPQEVQNLIDTFEEMRFEPENQEGALTRIQQEYFAAISDQTFSHLESLYSAEENGATFEPVQEAGEGELLPGVVYQYFGGYTTPLETPPDDGVPGLARIPKRFLQLLPSGQIARIDANEGYELSVVDGQLQAKLAEIRVHYTSDVDTGVGNQIFHRFHVDWENGTPHISIQPDFTSDNSPRDIGDASHLATPNSCLDCHVGTVAFARTDEVLLYQRPELTEEDLDDRNDNAFRLDNFLPDSVYLGSKQLGLKEVLAKWEPAILAENSTVRAALKDPETFQTPGIAEAFRSLHRQISDPN